MTDPVQDRLFLEPLSATETNKAAMLEYARDLRQKRAQGGRLSPIEWKVVERCAYLETAAVLWPDRAAVAADFKQLCGWTYNALDKAKCPWNAHGPTEKAPVLLWAIGRLGAELAKARRESRDSKAKAKLEDEHAAVSLRTKIAHAARAEGEVDKLTRRLKVEAEDAARALIVAEMKHLRLRLVDDLPGAIARLVTGKDQASAEMIIRHQIETMMRSALAELGDQPAVAPTPPPTAPPAPAPAAPPVGAA